jgi:hypothetical protein
MRARKQFASVAQRQAWRAECEREATRRMLRRLLKKLRQLAVQPVPKDQDRLAQEYRRARAAHVEALKRQREDAASSRQLASGAGRGCAVVGNSHGGQQIYGPAFCRLLGAAAHQRRRLPRQQSADAGDDG